MQHKEFPKEIFADIADVTELAVNVASTTAQGAVEYRTSPTKVARYVLDAIYAVTPPAQAKHIFEEIKES